MQFLNKYPYTDFHELNLDWLLKNYQAIIDEINEINTWVTQHQIEYEEAIARLQHVEGEIDTFEAQVNAAFEQLRQEQQQQLDDALASINLEVDEKLQQLEADVQTAINDIYAKYDQLQVEIMNELQAFRTQINNVVRSFDHVQVMLNHKHRVACFHQLPQHLDELMHIRRMEARGWLIQHVNGAAGGNPRQLRCQLYALRLAAGKGGG